MKKRVFSMIICVVLLFSAVAVAPNVTAYTAHTQSEAVSWMYSKNGVALDWDGSYGAQCVDLIYYYYNYLGVSVMGGNAKDYAWNALPNGWQRIRYYSGFVPQPGDIFVRTADGFVDGVYYGHIGLVISADAYNFSSMEQNYAGRQYCSSVNRKTSYIEYIIRPDFVKTPAQNPWMELGTVTDITETRVKLNATVRNPSAVTVTAVGCYIWDESGKLIRDHIEEMNSSYKTRDYVPAWFWTDSELGMTLKSGAKYRYQVFCKTSNGTVIKSKEDTFYTQGPPINVSLSADINHGETIYSERVINFKLYAEHADSYIFEIWKDNTRVYYNDKASNSISYTASDIGSYSAKFTAVKGTYESPVKEIHWQFIDMSSDISNEPSPPPAQGIPDVNESIKFIDVQSGKWYTEYVDYVAQNNLMNGMSENTFAPSDTLTRAMFVQILANAAGVDTSNRDVTTKFTDVPSGKWYTSAVKWASENNIVNGMTENTFDPQGNIQRQQMCVMLARFAKAFSIELGGSAEKAAFSDDNLIQNYAKEAVYTCQQAGIINGMTPDTFAPRDNATRAQIAKIMTVFHRDFMTAK